MAVPVSEGGKMASHVDFHRSFTQTSKVVMSFFSEALGSQTHDERTEVQFSPAFRQSCFDGCVDFPGMGPGRVRGLSPEFWSGKFWSGGPKFSVENWSGRTDFFGKNGPPLENWSE